MRPPEPYPFYSHRLPSAVNTLYRASLGTKLLSPPSARAGLARPRLLAEQLGDGHELKSLGK
jgi:hypothetical protein